MTETNDPKELAGGLHTIFEMLLDKQQAIVDKAWDRCRGGGPENTA